MIRYEIEADDHSSLIDRIRRDFAGLLNTRPYALATSDSLDSKVNPPAIGDLAESGPGWTGHAASITPGSYRAGTNHQGDYRSGNDHFDHIEEPELPGTTVTQKRKRRTKAEMAQADGPKSSDALAAGTSAGQAAVPDNTASVPAASSPSAEGASATAAVLGNDAGAAAPITLSPDEFRAKIQVWASEAEGRLPLVTSALAKLGVQKVKEVAAADYGSFLAGLGIA